MSRIARIRCWMVVSVLACSLGFGCIESNPQPSPLGGNDTQVTNEDTGGLNPANEKALESVRMALSAPSADGEVVGVGRDGAAEGAKTGAAYPSGVVDASGVSFKVGENGQFAFVASAAAKATVLLVFDYEESQEPTSATLTVPERDSADSRAPWLMDADSGFADPTDGSPGAAEGDWYNLGTSGGAGPVIAVVLDGDNVTVEGSPFATTPLSMVSVMNVQSGDSDVVQADASGGFIAILPAEAGDQLAMFVFNPEAPEKATSPWFFIVE